MTYDQWKDLQTRIDDKFQDVKRGKSALPDGPGELEFVEFKSPMGLVRLELWIRPKVLERKTIYSHRMNTAATVQYTYDETEHTFTFKAYRQDERSGEWTEVRAEGLVAAF